MSTRRLMVVEGYTVPAEIEDSARAFIRTRRRLHAREVVGFLHKAGVSRDVLGPADRIADRLLQSERRAGRIAFYRGAWDPA